MSISVSSIYSPPYPNPIPQNSTNTALQFNKAASPKIHTEISYQFPVGKSIVLGTSVRDGNRTEHREITLPASSFRKKTPTGEDTGNKLDYLA
jgi:hypothetical protein